MDPADFDLYAHQHLESHNHSDPNRDPGFHLHFNQHFYSHLYGDLFAYRDLDPDVDGFVDQHPYMDAASIDLYSHPHLESHFHTDRNTFTDADGVVFNYAVRYSVYDRDKDRYPNPHRDFNSDFHRHLNQDLHSVGDLDRLADEIFDADLYGDPFVYSDPDPDIHAFGITNHHKYLDTIILPHSDRQFDMDTESDFYFNPDPHPHAHTDGY